MATQTITIPKEFLTSMSQFVDVTRNLMKSSHKLGYDIAVSHINIQNTFRKREQTEYGSILTGMRKFEQQIRRLELSSTSLVGRMIFQSGPATRSYMNKITNVSSLLGEASPVLRLAGTLSERFGMAGLMRFATPATLWIAAAVATYKVIRWLWDHSLGASEVMMADRQRAMATGTTEGGIRALRVAFMGIPGIDEIMNNMTNVLMNMSGAKSLIVHKLLGVPYLSDSADMAAQTLISAQKFIKQFPREVRLLRAQRSGLTQIMPEQTISALGDMSDANLQAQVAWYMANKAGLTPDPEAVTRLIRFRKAVTRLWDSIINLLGETLSRSKLPQALGHLSEAFGKVMASIINSRAFDGIVRRIISGITRLTDWLSSGGHTIRNDINQAMIKAITAINNWTEAIRAIIRTLSGNQNYGVSASKVCITPASLPSFPLGSNFSPTQSSSPGVVTAPGIPSAPQRYRGAPAPFRPETWPVERPFPKTYDRPPITPHAGPMFRGKRRVYKDPDTGQVKPVPPNVHGPVVNPYVRPPIKSHYGPMFRGKRMIYKDPVSGKVLPVHPSQVSRAVTPQGSVSANLAADRTKYGVELQNPEVRERVYRMLVNEAGTVEGMTAVLESMGNRASVRHKSLSSQATSTLTGGYYKNAATSGTVTNPQTRAALEQAVTNFLSGSNVANYATENSSGTVAASSIRDTGGYQAEVHHEYFTLPPSDQHRMDSWRDWHGKMSNNDTVTAAPTSVSTEPTSKAPSNLTSPFPSITDFKINQSGVFGAARHSQRGGWRLHSGNDLHAPSGTPVLSMNDGTVLYNGYNTGYGANIVIKGNDGVIRRYAVHAQTENLPPGTKVTQGQRIGIVGEGHVHYEEVPPTIDGSTNPVYQEFERNASSNKFTDTSGEHGVVDPSGPLGTLQYVGKTAPVYTPVKGVQEPKPGTMGEVDQRPSAAGGRGTYYDPVTATKLGEGVGARGGEHQGVDVLAPYGSPIYAIGAGTIARHNPHGSKQGDAVTYIQLDDGRYVAYMHHHLDPNLKPGDHVEAGQQIGTSGQANGVNHLHFEIWGGPGRRNLMNPESVLEWGRGPNGRLPVGGQPIHPELLKREPGHMGLSLVGKKKILDDPKLPSEFISPKLMGTGAKSNVAPPTDKFTPSPKTNQSDDQPERPPSRKTENVGPGETKTVDGAHGKVEVKNDASNVTVELKPIDQSAPNPGRGPWQSPDDYQYPSQREATEEPTIPSNVQKFVKGIGSTETDFNTREAYSDKYNKASNNENVKKYGDAGKDYGYFQMNSFDVKEGINMGMEPEMALNLMGGSKNNPSSMEDQSAAVAEYIRLKYNKAYKGLVERGDFEGAIKAMNNKWFGLKNKPDKAQDVYKHTMPGE